MLGKIMGQWEYKPNGHLGKFNHIRECIWVEVPREKVPGSALHNRGVIGELRGLVEYSKCVYANLRGEDATVEKVRTGDWFQYLGPLELEDAVGLYLQVERNYVIVPSTCKQSTPDVEGNLINRMTGKTAFFQVKSKGASIKNPDFDTFDGRVYVMTVSNQRQLTSNNVEYISAEQVETFLRTNRNILPTWLKFAVDRSKASPITPHTA